MLVINLDPAVDHLPYSAAIDIRDLIRLEEVMEYHGLGPNGAILFCLEFLEKNFDWLADKLAALTSPDLSSDIPAAHDIDYIVLDLPGQVEISTDHLSLKNVLHKLEKLDWRVSLIFVFPYSLSFLVMPSYESMMMISMIDLEKIIDQFGLGVGPWIAFLFFFFFW